MVGLVEWAEEGPLGWAAKEAAWMVMKCAVRCRRRVVGELGESGVLAGMVQLLLRAKGRKEHRGLLLYGWRAVQAMLLATSDRGGGGKWERELEEALVLGAGGCSRTR